MEAAQPKFALARAEELLLLGNEKQAFLELRKIAARRRDWSKNLELLMLKYVELSILLNKGKEAKAGLNVYRQVCQLQHSLSLERVLRFFIESVATRTAEKRAEAESSVAKIMKEQKLSEEAAKESLERDLVTPSLKFQWETYRTALDILKMNTQLSGLYKEIVVQAFRFCLENERVAESKKLGGTIKAHMRNLLKYGEEGYFEEDFNVNHQLEIRFAQIETATALNQWSDAYKTIEDIRGIMSMSENVVSDKYLHQYYTYLGKLFWQGNNTLLHARALLRLLDISRRFSDYTDEKEALLSSQTLLACLVVTKTSNLEINEKMLKLFDIKFKPTREAVLKEMKKYKVAESAYPEIKEFHNQLEKNFDPYELPTHVRSTVEFLETVPILSKYKEKVIDIGVDSVVLHFSKIYLKLKIETLESLFPNLDTVEIEKRILNLQKVELVDCTINHRLGVIVFTSGALQSNNLRTNLSATLRKLTTVVDSFNPVPAQQLQEKIESLFVRVDLNSQDEKNLLNTRKATIEKIREYRGKEKLQEKEKNRQMQLDKIKKHQEEQSRLKRQAQDEKLAAEKKKEANREKITKAKEFKEELEKRKDITIEVDELNEDDDPDDFVAKQLKKLFDDKTRKEKKLYNLGLNMDYMVRAQRELESEIIKENWEKIVEKEGIHYESVKTEFLEKRESELERVSTMRVRFQPMEDSGVFNQFNNTIIRKKVTAAVDDREAKRRRKIARYLENRMPQYEAEERKKQEEAEEKRRQEEEERRLQAEKQAKFEEERKRRMGFSGRQEDMAPAREETWSRKSRNEMPSGRPGPSERSQPSRPSQDTSSGWARQTRDQMRPQQTSTQESSTYKPPRESSTRPPREEAWGRGPRQTSEREPTTNRPPQTEREEWSRGGPRQTSDRAPRQEESNTYKPPRGNDSWNTRQPQSREERPSSRPTQQREGWRDSNTTNTTNTRRPQQGPPRGQSSRSDKW